MAAAFSQAHRRRRRSLCTRTVSTEHSTPGAETHSHEKTRPNTPDTNQYDSNTGPLGQCHDVASHGLAWPTYPSSYCAPRARSRKFAGLRRLLARTAADPATWTQRVLLIDPPPRGGRDGEVGPSPGPCATSTLGDLFGPLNRNWS